MRRNGYGNIDIGIRDITECTTTTRLAWFIANYPQKFLEASNQTLYSLSIGPNTFTKNGVTIQDVYFYTAACMNHKQSSEQGQTGRIENIIDVTTPGKIDVYAKRGRRKRKAC